MTRVAVVGCGAIAESFHLPALARKASKGVSVVLVDPDPARAAAVGSSFGFTEVARSHAEILDGVDGAIIASPHHTHVPIAMDFVQAGVPVLSEKPLGTSTEEVRRLADASKRTGTPVAVNHTRRFIPACREIRRRVEDGSLGEIVAVDAVEGDRFGWPAATPALFGARSGGRGVLLDIGVHVLDLLSWWFGPGMEVDAYQDDSFGGSEAAAEVQLRQRDLRLSVSLSWLVKQRNTYRIVGRQATLEWAVYDLDRVSIRSASSGRSSPLVLRAAPREYGDLADDVVDNFLAVISGRESAAITPADALESLRLIETCYGTRTRFEMPWHRPQFEVPNAT